ncbi:hypothetical protein KAU55_04275, partial [Candidatus Bathyarchaeota archaeon]|nr:hypothetical protein [Candidatus Bathyarchaeota archaeon]
VPLHKRELTLNLRQKAAQQIQPALALSRDYPTPTYIHFARGYVHRVQTSRFYIAMDNKQGNQGKMD